MPRTIQSMDAFDIRLPLSQPLQLGAIYVSHRIYTMVRLTDSDGCTGTAVGLSRNAPVAQTATMTLAPTFIGTPVDRYSDSFSNLVRANVCLGTNGIFWRALSLLDCAFHDLQAISVRQPLYQFLGGKPKSTPCILVGGYPSPAETPESFAAEIEHLASFSPRGIKIGSSGSLEKDTARLRLARSVLPDSISLMIDLYWQFQASNLLIPYAQSWAELGMGWIEDPFAFDDYTSAASLAGSIAYPVAIGDEQCGDRAFLRLMDEGRVGVLRLDATVCGGIGAFARVAGEARNKGIPVACHVFPELHAQLAACTPGIEFVEMFHPSSGLDALDLVNTTPINLQDGGLVPAAEPGLGYTWNEEAIAAYRVET